MPVAGRGQPERLLQEHLPWRGGEQVCAPHHVVHALCGVVDHGREVVGNLAVAPANDEVSGFTLAILAAVTLKGVFELDGGTCLASIAKRSACGPWAADGS